MSDGCKCSNEGIISKHGTEIVQIQKDVDYLNKIYELIYGLTTNVSILAEKMTRVTDDVSSIKVDIEEMKDTDVTTNVSVLTEQMGRNIEDIGSIKKEVEEIKKQPLNDYIHYKRALVVFIMLAVVGAFLAGKSI